MEFEYKFTPEHIKWAEEQVWECKKEYQGDLSIYNKLAPYEYSQIEEFIPHKMYQDKEGYHLVNALELGAGLGRGSIFLNHKFQNLGCSWFLADRDGKTEKNTGAFEPKEDEYYCDFEATKSFCKLNGLKDYTLFDTEKEDWRSLTFRRGTFDFIFSFCSFGMHVPIERYLDKIIGACHENTTLIFGTRHRGYGANSFTDKFREVIYKESLKEAPFPIENWLILRGLK